MMDFNSDGADMPLLIFAFLINLVGEGIFKSFEAVQILKGTETFKSLDRRSMSMEQMSFAWIEAPCIVCENSVSMAVVLICWWSPSTKLCSGGGFVKFRRYSNV